MSVPIPEPSPSREDVEKGLGLQLQDPAEKPAVSDGKHHDDDDDNDNAHFSDAASHHDSSAHGEDEINRVPTHASQVRKSIGGVAKTITARSNASVVDPGPPPDGGLKAWTQAFMGHLVLFNTWGMIASFGPFQTHYTNNLGIEPSAASWIGSMQMLGHFSLGMFSGRALDAGFFHWAVVPGMLLAALGMFMTSLCSQYYQLFLAQGLMNGLGCGLQFTPTISLVTTYFSKNRSVAVAIMASGSATGGLVYPAMARQLLPRIGFPWTVRIMAFIMLVVGACYSILFRPRLPPRKSGPLFEFSAFKEPPYSLYLAGLFCLCLGQYFAFYYIGSFAVDIIHVPYSTSVNVLMIMNGLGIIGRLVPSFFADLKFGPFNTIIPFCFITSLLLFAWAAVSTPAGLYVFAVAYGIFVAGFQGLFPVVLASLTRDMSKAGTRNGMGFAVVGVAMLVGPPIAGALIQLRGGGYLYAQIFGGCALLVGSLILVVARLAITGWRFWVRV